MKRAFTLIEVLIAVIIIGLGMIGISALFAGAAKQQQSASQLSRSVTASQNAVARITERFLGIRDVTDVANCLYAGDGTQVPVRDRLSVAWRRLNATERNVLSLYQRPQGSNADVCSAIYLETPVPDFSPMDLRGATNPAPYFRKDGFDAIGNLSSAFPGGALDPYFPARSIIADGLEIDVYVVSGDANPTVNDPGFATPQIFTYFYDNSAPAGTGGGWGICNTNTIRLRSTDSVGYATTRGRNDLADTWNGAQGANGSDFIEINCLKCPQELTGAPFVAFINAMKIYPVLAPDAAGTQVTVNRYIQRIVVRDCRYRATEVLSLSDRVLSEDTADGVRDIAGVSLLVREATPTTAQVAIFTYALQAQVQGARFIPKEKNQTGQDADNTPATEAQRPIRPAALDLRYNQETESYWAFCNNDESWVAVPGQTILFAGFQPATLAATAYPGADAPVKVVQVLRVRNNGGYWCELDRAPRSSGTVVRSSTGALPQVATTLTAMTNAPGAGGAWDAFAVSATAKAESDISGSGAQVGGASDRTIWQLRPLDARVITVTK